MKNLKNFANNLFGQTMTIGDLRIKTRGFGRSSKSIKITFAGKDGVKEIFKMKGISF